MKIQHIIGIKKPSEIIVALFKKRTITLFYGHNVRIDNSDVGKWKVKYKS